MLKNDKKLNLCAKEHKIVKVEYFDEEWSGEVIANTKSFILLHEVKDFIYGGFVIFNKKFISKISRDKYEKFQQKVVKNCSKKVSRNLKWLDLKSFDSIFLSLKRNSNGFCVDSTEDIDTFFVGKIEQFDDTTLSLKAINLYAKFYKKPICIKTKDIGYILFEDSYSSSLLKCAK